MQRGQIDALRLARERIQVSIGIPNLDLVVLEDKRHNDGIDTTSFARILRAGPLATRVHKNVSVLSTYLGHVCVAGTYWYLSAWPELMAQAMARLERRWGEPS